MTDRPNGGAADTAVGPMPGYYPDPSIPGFVRYWGGTGWVPGTTRPAPAEGEVLEPPRIRNRHTPPVVPPTAAPPPATPVREGAPAGPFAVPPSESRPSGVQAAEDAAFDVFAPSEAAPAEDGSGSAPTPAVPSLPDWPSPPLSASETRTGPVYFDETSAGASFVMAAHAELELRPRADVEALRSEPAALRPVPATSVPPTVVPPVALLQGPGDATGDTAAEAVAARAGASGWQADPRAQRGLLETGAAPRWVSWGVLPVGSDAEAPEGADGVHAAAPPSFPAPAPVRAMPAAPADPEQSEAGPEPEATSAPDAPEAAEEVPSEPEVQPGAAPEAAEPRDAEAVESVREPVSLPEAAESPAEESRTAAPAAPTVPEVAVPAVAEAAARPAAVRVAGAPAVPAPGRQGRPGWAVPQADRGRPGSQQKPAGPRTAEQRPSRPRSAESRPSEPRPSTTRPSGVRAPESRPSESRKTATPKPAPLQSAGLGRRLAARVVDSLVVLVVAVAAGVPLGTSAVAHVQAKLEQARTASALAGHEVRVWLVDEVVLGKAGVLLGVLVLLGLLYEVLPTARTGQTFGKRLARVRVVDVRAGRGGGRKPPSVGRSLVRWAVRQFAVLMPVGLLWPLFDRRTRRGWQDRAAGTRVVKG
ncbi:RDD family protein [Kitasatospora sp. NPDC051914]|uniref:RDD family protein n=1 Tax=Kitasatospora sp. NPDC051914 TaxID=3154945 RepID=UPI00341354DE